MIKKIITPGSRLFFIGAELLAFRLLVWKKLKDLCRRKENKPVGKIAILYDGNCEFCRWSMEWLKKRDKNLVLYYVPCGSEEHRKEFPQISTNQCLEALQVVLPNRSSKSGFDGIAYIMKFLPGWKFWSVVSHLPGMNIIGRFVYRWIAKNRYRIKCGENRCHL